MDLSPAVVRARFNELTVEHDRVSAILDPLRAELDATVNDETLTLGKIRAVEARIRPEIVRLQVELAPIESERALCARALGGKTSA